ncbi:hypothetical protein CBW54_21525 [Yersinia kristensenii]|nr:hypothetical protein CBW54_21525 [Yersinia kristensenii]
MKIGIHIEADSVNVLALNLGRIAVDIDGIELAKLMEAINGNGNIMQSVDAPEHTRVVSAGSLTPEEGLEILINWLQDNIDCGSPLIFDNDEDKTDSAALLPLVQQAQNAVWDLRHLGLL